MFEMPNTSPLTTTPDALADKMSRAKDRMLCEHAFYVGGTKENAAQLAELERLPGCCGVKIFMGSSTGNLLTEDDPSLRRILGAIKRRCAVHAEDEPRLRERQHLAQEAADPSAPPVWRDSETALRATRRLIAIARETGARVHVLHITTAEEIRFLAENKDISSVEVTPQHLTLSAPDCYTKLGTRAQMNPPIRDESHRQGLWWGLQQGVVDVLGSDHAPHTLEAKSVGYPKAPAGMPGVETSLPLMLTHAMNGKCSIMDVVRWMCEGPAKVYGMRDKGSLSEGMDGDLVLVDMENHRTFTDADTWTRVGWTPFNGMSLTGWPMLTVVDGQVVHSRDQGGSLRGNEVAMPGSAGRVLEFD